MKYKLKELDNNSSIYELEEAIQIIIIALSKAGFEISKEIYDSLTEGQQKMFTYQDNEKSD